MRQGTGQGYRRTALGLAEALGSVEAMLAWGQSSNQIGILGQFRSHLLVFVRGRLFKNLR